MKIISGIQDFWSAVSYGWFMTRKHHFRPWRSPAIKWRMETVYGIQPENLTAKLLFKTLWNDRKQVWALAKWVREMKQHR